MPRLNLRKFQRKASIVQSVFDLIIPITVPEITSSGVNLNTAIAQNATDISSNGTTSTSLAVSVNSNSASIVANTSAISSEKNRLDILLDSGTALDSVSELLAAWTSADSSVTDTVNLLINSATSDRALIRSEVATADNSVTTALTPSFKTK